MNNRKIYEETRRDYVLENVDLDKALTLTDYGCFHYKITASCVLCLFVAGLQNSLPAYVLPAARCELNLQSSQIGFINVAFLLGGSCSSFLWGIAADLTGRKRILAVTLLLDFVVTATCSLVQNFAGLIICRFVSGFLIGAPGSLTFTYLSEFQAPHLRSKVIYYSGMSFSLSWLTLPIAAWLVLSLKIQVFWGSFVVCSAWRIFLVLVAIAELISGVWILFLPESPKFLAISSPKKALQVLQTMYALNTGKQKGEYPVKNLKGEVLIPNHTSTGINCRGKAIRLLENMDLQIRGVLKAPYLSLTLVISGLMLSNMFGYFGLGLWLPELLDRFNTFQELYPNKSVTVDQLTKQTLLSNSSEPCSSEFDSTLFESTMAISVTALLGNILSGWFSGKLEYRVIPSVTMFLSAASAGLIYWLISFQQMLIVACVFQATISVANIAIGNVVVELFPTSISAIAICSTMFGGRIGAILSNIAFGFLVDFNCEVPIFVVAGVLMFGFVLCCMIPRNRKTKKVESRILKNRTHLEVSVISLTSL